MKFSLPGIKNVPTKTFPDGPTLKDEAMLIKERLNKDELATFTASNGWLEKFKKCTDYVRRGLLVKRTR